MSYRNRWPQRRSGNQQNIHWQTTFYSEMDNSDEDQISESNDVSESDQQPSAGDQSQPRIFKNGEETTSLPNYSGASNFQSLSFQKSKGHSRNSKPRSSYRMKGLRYNNPRRGHSLKRQTSNRFGSDSKSLMLHSNEDEDDESIPSENLKISNEYQVEYLPNSVNVTKNKPQTSGTEESQNQSFRSFDMNDYNDKVLRARRLKEEYESMMRELSAEDIIMKYRAEIEEMSNECIKKHLDRIGRIASLMQTEKGCFDILTLHKKNLYLQQKNFDAYISSMKHECSAIHGNEGDDIIKKADSIKHLTENECGLFQRTFPGYGYKDDILEALNSHQVIIVSSDSSYFFNTVIPIVVAQKYPSYSVLSCESSDASCEWVKDGIKNVVRRPSYTKNINCMNESALLNYIKENVKSSENCFIVNLPLKRSVTMDLLLACSRDILFQHKNCKLILLLSIFDNAKKYENYFSKFKVFLREVPKLLLPITTVWKKEPLSVSKNYKDDIVGTALAIHILNDPGDVLAFLPSLADAKAVVSILVRKFQEMNIGNAVECILLHENSRDVVRYKKPNAKKRRIFCTVHFAEAIPFPSVRYVIDCGITRDYIFDGSKNLDVLTTEFNSRAKARMRKSLMGIYTSGTCYRIYNKEDFCTNMPSFDLPDILTLNPFNTLVEVFNHRQEKALTTEFVDPLSDALKYNTVKLLKNFNAIKNGILTPLGLKMVKLPFPARYSKLILQGNDWGFAYEAIILVAYFSVDSYLFKYTKDEEYQRVIDASKLELMQHDSDPLSFLSVFKCWKENNCSSTWCERFHIECNMLNEVNTKVDEICQVVSECLNISILQEFSDMSDSAAILIEMLFQCFSDNLCVFSGHYRCGYRILSSRQTAFVHPSSIFCNKENFPQLIIFDKIINTSRNFLLGITSVPEKLILDSLTDKTLDYDFSDIFDRVLESETIEPVGERIINQVLLGKKGKRLLEIEESIKKELNSEFLVIDPFPEKGCVKVHALKPVLEPAVSKVEQILKTNLDDVINAQQVYTLDLKRGENKVLLEVTCALGAKITSVKVKDKADQSVSAKNLGASSLPAKDSASSIQYSINLTWIRRACNGICYVKFTPESFVAARRLAMRTIDVLQSKVYVEVSKKDDNELILTEVPREARANDIREAVNRYLPKVHIVNIELKYMKPFETTDREISEIKMEIENLCEEDAELLEFEVIVPKPKNTATIMTAFVNVFGIEDLAEAAEKLSNILFRNFKLTAIPVYRSVIKVSDKVYRALKFRISEGIDKLKSDLSLAYPNQDLFRFEAEHKDSNLILLKLLSNDMKIMKHLQKTVNQLLEGEILNKDHVKDIHKLFCHGGHMWLRTLEKSKSVYILEEHNSKTIRVYGSRESCFKVRDCIINFLEDTENEAVETIILSNDKSKRVLMKTLIKEYGVNLDQFIENCGLRSAVLDIKSCRLLLHGSRESIDQAKELLNQLSSQLDSTEEYSLLCGGETCPVCDCPAFNLTVRLQHCNHLYCNECILGLVEQATFPIQCCAENCSEDIVLDDIVKILEEDDTKIKKLLHASLDDFLEKKRSEIFYCPAPDCQMFAYKNEVPEKWMCPLCQNEICTKCNVVYHHGFTCDVFQGSKKDPDYSFKIWKKGTTECKECPSCKTAIEKNEGCDHMTCITCKAHFCWVCCRQFPTDVAVYNHIPFCDQYPQW